MNELHDLLDKLKKLEEAAVAPTLATFKPQYYHEVNIGNDIPVMMTDPGVFWYEGTDNTDPETGGRSRGAGQTVIRRLYGDPNARGITAIGSVDGRYDPVTKKKTPFPPGVTWYIDLENTKKAAEQEKASLAQTQDFIKNQNDSLAQTDADMAKYRANFAKDPLGANGAKLPNTTGAQPAPVEPAPAPEAPAVTGGTATVGTTPSVSQGTAATVPAEVTANLARVKQIIGAMKEGIKFKSRIGNALLESFDLQINEDATADLAELNKIWPSCVKWAQENPADAVAKDIEGLRDAVTKWQASVQGGTISAAGTSATPAAVVGSAALDPAQGGGSDTTIASGPETAVGGDAVVPAPVKKIEPSPEVAKLAKDNNIADPNAIKPGQKITMPDGTIYTVVPGDTLTAIQAGKGKGKYEKPESAPQAKIPTKVTDVSPENQNMAGTKSTLKPDEIKAAQEALKDPNISARDKAYYTELLKNQPASATGDTADQARPGLDPKKGKPEIWDRQKQLADLGAKGKDGLVLKTDGIKGNDTIKAEKEFGSMIIDPKTEIRPNGPHGVLRPVNPADIKSIQSWIKAVKAGSQKMEQVPPVYMDIVKKQLAIKESTGFANEELSRIISLVHHR